MKNVLLVFIGGGLGSSLRYLIGKFLNNKSDLPYGTFGANLLGCLIIGIVIGYISKNNALSEQHSLLLATGFCGGLTTFSTFALENLNFAKSNFISLVIYSTLTFSLGITLVFLGMQITKA